MTAQSCILSTRAQFVMSTAPLTNHRRVHLLMGQTPNGPLVGLTPVASLEFALELIAQATGLCPEHFGLGIGGQAPWGGGAPGVYGLQPYEWPIGGLAH